MRGIPKLARRRLNMRYSPTGPPSCVHFLAAKARLDIQYKDGQIVLHSAAARGNREIIDSLLGAGAVVDAVDANGHTPLDEAVLHGRGDALALLLAHGADTRRVHSPKTEGDRCTKLVSKDLRRSRSR